MWSFILVFLLVMVALALFTHPVAVRIIDTLTNLSAFLLIAIVASLLVWLALFGGG